VRGLGRLTTILKINSSSLDDDENDDDIFKFTFYVQ